MKYMLKQRLMAFGDDFDVYDENGRKAYYFDSKIGGFRPRIIVQDATGRQIGLIKKKLFTFRPTYLVYRDSDLVAEISQKLFSFRKSFVVKPVSAAASKEVNSAELITVTGSFVEHSYYFYRARQQIAQVSKKWFTAKDTYGVDIDKGDDAFLVLSAAVIVDILCHPKRDSGF